MNCKITNTKTDKSCKLEKMGNTGSEFSGRKKITIQENNDKSKKKGETCRTKIAGNAEKIGKTSCDEWKNMVKFPQ